jgi:hypothetical protein
LEFEAENDLLHAIVRLYLSGTTLYEVLVAYPISKPYGHATQFFGSFQLIPRTVK